jgi:hypothetical protein
MVVSGVSGEGQSNAIAERSLERSKAARAREIAGFTLL